MTNEPRTLSRIGQPDKMYFTFILQYVCKVPRSLQPKSGVPDYIQSTLGLSNPMENLTRLPGRDWKAESHGHQTKSATPNLS